MKAALDEMGFQAKGQRINRLVLWEEQERNEMEHILQQHGYAREDKNAHYAHMSVEDFKASRDKDRMRQKLRESQHVTEEDLSAENVRSLRSALTAAEQRVSELEEERQSPYKAFFYSSPEKQAWVMKKMDEMNIPYRETENGFEAQACYVDMIRKLEKEYKTPRTLLRDQLREDIDRGVLQSATIYDLQKYLEQLGYIVKFGKYLSVLPQGSNAFIRVKSLGEHYSDFALHNRIKANAQYAKDLAKEMEDALNRNATTYPVLRVVQLYMVAFTNRALPIRKVNAMKPVEWTNDAELDRLLALNRRIADGASLETLRMEFAEKEKMPCRKRMPALYLKADDSIAAFSFQFGTFLAWIPLRYYDPKKRRIEKEMVMAMDVLLVLSSAYTYS